MGVRPLPSTDRDSGILLCGAPSHLAIGAFRSDWRFTKAALDAGSGG